MAEPADEPLELRVLTGLHRGAALFLVDDEFFLGSDPACAVVLLDAGIAERHLRISRHGEAWVVEPCNGASTFCPGVATAGGALPIDSTRRVRVGDVWIGFARLEDPWPDAAELALLQQSAEQVNTVAGNPASGDHAPRQSRRRRINKWIAVLGTAAVLFFATWLLGRGKHFSTAPTSPGQAAGAAPAAPAPNAFASHSETATHSNMTTAAPPGAQAGPEQMRVAVAGVLGQYGLDHAVKIDAEPGRLNLHAVLSPRDVPRFEKSLLLIQRRFGENTRIDATVAPVESALPFRVRQILLGGDSRIILSDGRSMYEGDQLDGVKLVSIRAGTLVFTGRSKIEVPW
ncbi:hypothetical protein DBA29_26110 [Xenophilus aerolatus]|nr:hypothetical protein [Xenophilus aerolatus]